MLCLSDVKKLRTGQLSEQDKARIVKLYSHYCKGVALKYCLRRRFEDYYAEALFGISEAIRQAPLKMYDDDADRWIKFRIIKAVRGFRARDHLILVPPGSKSWIKNKGDELQSRIQRELMDGDVEPTKFHTHQDMTEYLKKAAISDLEKEILDLKIQGYTDNEVSEILEVTPWKVWKVRKDLETKFIRVMKEHS